MGVTQKIKFGVGLLVLLGVSTFLLPLSGWAANFLQNDGLEPPFDKYGEWSGGGHTFDLEVAHNWERFFIAAGTEDNGNKLRYFSSSAVAFLFGGNVEKQDGADSQIWWSTAPFDAGIYQQVSGLTVGQNYGFQAGILQVYGNTTSGINNKMFRSVGIDPTGGADPTGPNVIWSPEEGKNGNWFYPGVGAQAISSTVTVFIKVRAIDDAPQFEENAVWADNAFLDVAPTTSLSLTVDSPSQVTAAWSSAPHPGFHLFAYEAQYRKASQSSWTDLQIFTSQNGPSTNTGKSFNVESGVEYVVRARAWHEQDGPDSHEVPGPWAEATVTAGGIVSGRVLDNQADPFGGATVSVSGLPGTNTASRGDGGYDLLIGAGSFGLTSTGGSGWAIPQPVGVTVPNLESITPLTLTLRPPDDIISNGDFENGLAGWQVSGTLPVAAGTHYRTISHSLRLADNVTISQTGSISGAYKPTLAFWYKVDSGDGDDTFTAQILGPGGAAANSFNTGTAGQWQFAWLPLNLTEVYTGPVGVRFSLSQSAGPTQTVVYVDEVSLGSVRQIMPVYLPIVMKE